MKTPDDRSPLLADLRWRGLVEEVSSAGELDEYLLGARRSIYIGFDPTADSLHIGSLLPLLVLRRVQQHGHRPIVLIGGGTGLIGDPSGKTGERALNPTALVAEWADRLREQVKRFVDFDGGSGAALLVDNYAWLGSLDVISFLRDVGKHFPLGTMLAKESVRSRMGRAEAGISYTEFSYQVLQAYDFLSLARVHGCVVQMGGTDQWGNITAGIELIRRVLGAQAFGVTHPLVVRADGAKFGKTETGTVWLDAAKTTPYEMYQFWLNTSDADVGPFLRYFTFMPREEIDALAAAAQAAPERREAQRALARSVTELVHGREAMAAAEAIGVALFSGRVRALSEAQLEQACRGMGAVELARGEIRALPIPDLLVRLGVAESKREARELVGSGAIFVNDERLGADRKGLPDDGLLHGRFLIVRKGRRSYHAATISS